jgi:hypothetical protein
MPILPFSKMARPSSVGEGMGERLATMAVGELTPVSAWSAEQAAS